MLKTKEKYIHTHILYMYIHMERGREREGLGSLLVDRLSLSLVSLIWSGVSARSQVVVLRNRTISYPRPEWGDHGGEEHPS